MTDRWRNLLAHLADLAFIGLIVLWVHLAGWMISHDFLFGIEGPGGTVPGVPAGDDLRGPEAVPR